MSSESGTRAEVIDFTAPYIGAGSADYGTPTPEDMTRINQLAMKPLAPDQVFVVPARISRDDRVDNYYTVMHESTLRNYATEAADGVPFMNSHRTNPTMGIELPVGRTIAGTLRQTEDGRGLEVVSRSFIVRGRSPNGPGGLSTDDLIRGIEDGTVADVSVGFYLGDTGSYECRICGNDPTEMGWLYEAFGMDTPADVCPHILGNAYDTAAGKRIADAWVKDSHLAEQSSVFRGATPTASFLKAERMLALGMLSAAEIGEFEHHHNRSLRTVHPGAGVVSLKPPRKEPAMPSFARDLLARFSIATPSDEVSLDDACRLLEEHQQRQGKQALEELQARLSAQEPRVKMADKLLADLIEDTVAWGVRADPEFACDNERAILSRVGDVELIQQKRESFRTRAERNFGASNRTSSPQQPPEQPDRGRSAGPASPYDAIFAANRY